MPLVLPLAGGVLMLLLASIAVFHGLSPGSALRFRPRGRARPALTQPPLPRPKRFLKRTSTPTDGVALPFGKTIFQLRETFR